jgi:hypothetical protein
MMGFRKLSLIVAITALPLSLAAGWYGHTCHEPQFIAHARISIPAAAGIRPPGDSALPNLEEMLLAPDVVTAAIDLLAERGFVLPVDPAADSEVNFILNRTDTTCQRHGDQDEIDIHYRAAKGEMALATLSAIADAGIHALRSNIPPVEDPAAGGRERERVQIAKACEDARRQVADLQKQIEKRDAALPGSPATDRPRQALEAEFENLRQRRVDAEDRLADARRQIRAGVDVAAIMADLPEDQDWGALRESLTALQWEAELRQKVAACDVAASIYGRNHPRMTRLQGEADALRKKLSALKPAQSGNSSAAPPLASDVILNALEVLWQQAATAEQGAQAQLEAARAARDQQQGLEARLADARQELAFLNTEQERIEHEITEARREVESRLPGLAGPPTLEDEPVMPALTAYLLWAAAIGIALAALFWRLAGRIGSRREPSRAVRVRGRVISREEDNLARLRRLKPAA